MTIFLVDDDEDDRRLFIEATKEVDHSITCLSASDGLEALTYLRDERNNVQESVRLKELGAVHFASKPISEDEVYYMASFVLGERW